jgi:hypothetical protein
VKYRGLVDLEPAPNFIKTSVRNLITTEVGVSERGLSPFLFLYCHVKFNHFLQHACILRSRNIFKDPYILIKMGFKVEGWGRRTSMIVFFHTCLKFII